MSEICPICKGEVIIEKWYTDSGRKITRIGCETENCPNNIIKSPRHTSLPATMRSWENRQWDGHHHRKPKEMPVDTRTLPLF